MNGRRGFRFRAAAALVLLLAVASCNREQPAAPAPTGAERPGETPFPRVAYEQIDLPQARLTVSRERTGSTPLEVLRLSVKMAEDIPTRSRGLMGVPSLPSSAGMVFSYGRPTRGGFHMKNTLIPLDIAFWGEDRKIHQIMRMTPCKAEPCPTYQPRAEYIGALEVKAGLLRQKGVRTGDAVTITVQTAGS